MREKQLGLVEKIPRMNFFLSHNLEDITYE